MAELRELVDVDFPLFAFSHCRDVVAAVTRAGGFGVLGGTSFRPDELETELSWLDANTNGKPYGIDILIPEHQAIERSTTAAEVVSMVPQAQRDFVVELLHRYGIDITVAEAVATELPGTAPEVGEQLMDVAFRHPIKLIANALGIAPQSMIGRARAHGVPVAALVGAKEHAIRQVNAGVDIIVAQGGEAGGHCGEVSTLVLIPEVIRAVDRVRSVPVLAAGGIMTGAQMAGMMAMGAAGAWTGSVWLATPESEVSPVLREKMVAASSRDTVRSTSRTGKPSRQLHSAWQDAWDGPGSPGSLPLPIMPLISQPAFRAIDAAADRGNLKARELVSYWVGQGVGLVESVRPAEQVVAEFMADFADAVDRLSRPWSQTYSGARPAAPVR